jgi:hypothetical protein
MTDTPDDDKPAGQGSLLHWTDMLHHRPPPEPKPPPPSAIITQLLRTIEDAKSLCQAIECAAAAAIKKR